MNPDPRPARLIERLIPLAITALTIGPLAHMALHRPNHGHSPDGAVVFFEPSPAAEPHRHPHPHEHPHGAEAPDGPPDHDHPQHDAGGAAHLGFAPPPPSSLALPARRVDTLPDPPPATPPAYEPLRGHLAPVAHRARAPPRRPSSRGPTGA